MGRLSRHAESLPRARRRASSPVGNLHVGLWEIAPPILDFLEMVDSFQGKVNPLKAGCLASKTLQVKEMRKQGGGRAENPCVGISIHELVRLGNGSRDREDAEAAQFAILRGFEVKAARF